MEITQFINVVVVKAIIEILILWFVVYHIIIFFEGTRAIQVLRGIVVIMLGFFICQKFGLDILNWLLAKLFAISVIALLIIFHPEVRQGLARLGQHHPFSTALKDEELDYTIIQILNACDNLCREGIGALIVLENHDPLRAYIESGVRVEAKVSADLIQTIFTPNSLLHDGGLIIQHGRIVAAGCLFPLTQNETLSRMFGTRHRAALGLSEETDALVLIVSEERKDISLAYGGRMHKDLSREELISRIKDIRKYKKKDG